MIATTCLAAEHGWFSRICQVTPICFHNCLLDVGPMSLLQNGSSICLTIFAWLTSVTNTQTQTERDHATREDIRRNSSHLTLLAELAMQADNNNNKKPS